MLDLSFLVHSGTLCMCIYVYRESITLGRIFLNVLHKDMALLKCRYCNQRCRTEKTLLKHERGEHGSPEQLITTRISTNSGLETFTLPNDTEKDRRMIAMDDYLGTCAVDLPRQDRHLLGRIAEKIKSLDARLDQLALDMIDRTEPKLREMVEGMVPSSESYHRYLDNLDKQLHALGVKIEEHTQKLQHIDSKISRNQHPNTDDINQTELPLQSLRAENAKLMAASDKVATRLDLISTEQQSMTNKCRDGFQYVDECLRRLAATQKECTQQFGLVVTDHRDQRNDLADLTLRIGAMEEVLRQGKYGKLTLQEHILAALEKVREFDETSK